MELLGKEITLKQEFVDRLANKPKKNKFVVIAITGGVIGFRPYYTKDITYTARLSEFINNIDNRIKKETKLVTKETTTVNLNPITSTPDPNPYIATTPEPDPTPEPITTTPIPDPTPEPTDTNTFRYLSSGFTKMNAKSLSSLTQYTISDMYGGLYG